MSQCRSAQDATAATSRWESLIREGYRGDQGGPAPQVGVDDRGGGTSVQCTLFCSILHGAISGVLNNEMVMCNKFEV